MLGAAQADALRTEFTRELRVVGIVCIGTHAQPAELIGPFQDGVQISGQLGLHQVHRAQDHDAGRAVDGDEVALADD